MNAVTLLLGYAAALSWFAPALLTRPALQSSTARHTADGARTRIVLAPTHTHDGRCRRGHCGNPGSGTDALHPLIKCIGQTTVPPVLRPASHRAGSACEVAVTVDDDGEVVVTSHSRQSFRTITT